ncbi:MAG TPA: aldo/keto reductase [Candidatus Binatia bacterium]|jgi:aryl-alcohol dehydrogenase-like predicted oxidoreductase
MEFTTLSGTGLTASRIGLGTWAIGGWSWGGTDESDAIATIRRAIDRGINVIDTAPVYGFGRSEELVGKALVESRRRGDVVIATKVGLEWRDGNIFRNSSADRIRAEIDDSLRLLQTDVIDLYQVHWPDPKTSIEETAETLADLKRQGKIRAIGVSNYSPGQMDAFRRAAPLNSSQPPYNLFEREIEADVLPYCRNRQITAITYGALCRGLLSGRMKPNMRFPDDDIRRMDPKFRQPRFARYIKAVERLDELAQKRFGRRVIHLAVRWLLDQPGVDIALWGARSPNQLDPLDEVFGWSIDAESAGDIDRIVEEEVGVGIGAEFMAPP